MYDLLIGLWLEYDRIYANLLNIRGNWNFGVKDKVKIIVHHSDAGLYS